MDHGLRVAQDYLREHFPHGPRAEQRTWSSSITRDLLANRIYIGEMRAGDIVKHFPDLALVDRMIFDLAQHAPRPHRPRDTSYPLSKIATCAVCGTGLVGQTLKKRRYRCPKGCLSFNADPLEEMVLEACRGVAVTDSQKVDTLGLSVAIMAASKELDRWVADPELFAKLGADTWQKGLDARQEALGAAQLAWDEAIDGSLPVPDLTDPSPDEMRLAFERLVATATVKKGPGPLSERVELALAGC